MKKQVNPLPYVSVSGTALECGISLGKATKDQIEHSLSTYRRTFELCDISWSAAIEKAAGCREVVAEHCPHLLEELEGLSRGSGVDEESLFTLNCRTEILPPDFLAKAMATAMPASNNKNIHANECTSFAFAADQSPVWLSQNWDWVGLQRQALRVVESQQATRPAYITVTEAGMLAKIGFNDQGLGVTLNILRSHNDGQHPGMPVHFLLRALLDCKSVKEACDFVSSLPFASSSNVMIAQRATSNTPAEIVNIELAPNGCKFINPTDDRLCHTNHFLHNELAANDAGLDGNISTVNRLDTAQANLNNLSGFDDIKKLLSDTSDGTESICRFPDPSLPEIAQIETVVGVAMNLTDSTLWVTGAQPSISDFVAHHLQH